jgi:predicted amidohydrolase YtcJ
MRGVYDMILWKNGILHTLENEQDVHYQMATDQGHIIGFDEDVKDLTFDQEIDLKGYHLYPGFVDAHLHIVGYGQKLSKKDLSSMRQKDDILAFIKTHVGQGFTFYEGYFDQGITKDELDEISNEKPIILKHNDYHSLTVNSVVLKHVNLASDSGFLTEEDAQKVNKTYEVYDHEHIKKMIKHSISSLQSFGVTGGHSDDLYYFNGYHDTLTAFLEVLEEKPFRIHLLMHHKIIEDYKASKHPFLDQNKYLQLGAVKIFYDGTFSSKTALLKDHYKGLSHQGIRIFEKDELIELVKKIRSYELPLAIHVIGDLGLKEVVELLKAYPPKKGLHDRIIHASLADLKTIEMMEDMPIILDVQPQFISSDLPHILSLFSKEPAFIYPFKTYMRHNLILCGSSDAPVEIPNPLLGMYQLVFRKKDGVIYQQEECISRFNALKLYTTYANVPTYKTNRGMLKKGFIADFTVLSEDVLTMDESSFFKDLVKMTIIDEQIVHHA